MARKKPGVNIMWDKNWERTWKKAHYKGKKSIYALTKGMAKRLLRKVVKNTPKDSGNTARAWGIKRVDKQGYVLYNRSKAIRFLEYGGFKKLRSLPRRAQRAFWAQNKGKKGSKNKLVRGKRPYTRTYAHKDAPRGILRIALRKMAKKLKRAQDK